MDQTQRTRDDPLGDVDVIDVETHTHETYPMLVEYIEDEGIRTEQEDGFVIGSASRGPLPWDGWDRTAGGRTGTANVPVESVESYDDTRRGMGIDTVCYSPGIGFKIFQIPDAEARIAYMRAMNRSMVERFAKADGVSYGKLLVVPDHPEESAAEIRRHGDEAGILGVFFVGMLDFPFGHERYEPVLEAAEEVDLPFFIHGDSTRYPKFPTTGFNGLDTFVEVHTLVHPFLQLWHATSLIGQEIPERYDVDVCFLEAGQSWVQLLANRMDREYLERPNDIPGLQGLPSDYLAEFYYGTQPIEEPRDPAAFRRLIEENGLEDQLVLTTDYPHMDFDAPAAVTDHEGLTDEQKRKIVSENPRALLGL